MPGERLRDRRCALLVNRDGEKLAIQINSPVARSVIGCDLDHQMPSFEGPSMIRENVWQTNQKSPENRWMFSVYLLTYE